MSFITTKFHEILLSGFRGVVLTSCFSSIFHFGQIYKLKKRSNSEKNYWIKISCEYAHLHSMSFITTKFYEILLSGFRGVWLTRKTGRTDGRTDGLTDWLTDWRTDGSKTLYPPQLVAWGIKTQSNIIKSKNTFLLAWVSVAVDAGISEVTETEH